MQGFPWYNHVSFHFSIGFIITVQTCQAALSLNVIIQHSHLAGSYFITQSWMLPFCHFACF